MKNKYITDTMALILRLENRKLPKKVEKIFTLAEKNEVEIYIPAIVLAEIGYLSEKHKIEIDIKEVKIYCQNYKSIKQKEITFKTIESAFNITDIPELHDRIISGSSTELNASLLTNDPVIENSDSVKTIWK